MNELEYYAGEFTDEFLHAQADAGEFYLRGLSESNESDIYGHWFGR